MKIPLVLKNKVYAGLRCLFLDSFFRHLHRNKVLILAYHGVTTRTFPVQPWTLIPLESFKRQMEYLRRRYTVIPLEQAVSVIVNGGLLPRNPAVITFDDGYRNNHRVAYPVLKQYGLPATIFLTAGYIGSREVLPLDEVFLAITHAKKKELSSIPEIGLGPLPLKLKEEQHRAYRETVRILKQYPTAVQKKCVSEIKRSLASDYESSDDMEEFRLLSREETVDLMSDGLIQIGAHTISHEICTNLTPEAAEREITGSKQALEAITGREIKLFAYPNGTENDYNEKHIKILKGANFFCSVTTTARFNGIGADPFRLGRICIGPEMSIDDNIFALNVSGAAPFLRKIIS